MTVSHSYDVARTKVGYKSGQKEMNASGRAYEKECSRQLAYRKASKRYKDKHPSRVHNLLSFFSPYVYIRVSARAHLQRMHFVIYKRGASSMCILESMRVTVA
jgi:hypothetical protein